ncbi:hypothetical protein [Arenimonas sp. MALMAid1274]|uniref:hypothetical protein n=1 Tax=Arenimonas sp. MALMAid1274 TaxID=3411630 RepID=UPI003BA1EE1F
MKCIFAATPYSFSIQYHAYALVALHADTAWTMSIEGFAAEFRMQECEHGQAGIDESCAVFVPVSLGRRGARLLLTAFNAAHPGVLPPSLHFQFNREHWWQPARRGLPALARDHDGTVTCPRTGRVTRRWRRPAEMA